MVEEAWRSVFYITASIYAFGTIFYALFGSGDRQPWASTNDLDDIDYSVNTVYGTERVS